MKRIVATMDVDEAVVQDTSECDSFSDAVRSEFGWLRDSGMYVIDWKEVASEESQVDDG